MKTLDIIKSVDAGKLPLIKFNKKVEEIDSNIDINMIGRVVSYQKHNLDDVYYVLTVDLGEHIAHNKKVAKANYFDANSNPVLTVFETNFIKDNKTELYVMPTDDIGEEYAGLTFNEWWTAFVNNTSNIVNVKYAAEQAWNAAKEYK